jgi:hypothetical protein
MKKPPNRNKKRNRPRSARMPKLNAVIDMQRANADSIKGISKDLDNMLLYIDSALANLRRVSLAHTEASLKMAQAAHRTNFTSTMVQIVLAIATLFAVIYF